VADRGDAMLEIECLAAVAVGLQELMQRLADRHVGDAPLLHLGSPLRPVVDAGADLRHAEPHAESLDAVAAVNAAVPEGGVRRARRDFAVDLAEIGQDQPRDDQRVDNSALGLRRPAVQLAQHRQVIALGVVSDEAIGARQVLERGGDLIGPVLVDALAIEIGDDDAVRLGDGVEQAVGFDVEYQARAFTAGVGRGDEGPGEARK
jgi:hypothetical protein